MTKEEINNLNKKVTDVSNYILEREKKSSGRCVVTTSEGKVVGVIE